METSQRQSLVQECPDEHTRQHEAFLDSFAFLTKNFKTRHLYWECFVLARKVLVMSISAFAPSSSNMPTLELLLALVLLASLVLHTRYMPYEDETLDALELGNLLACTVSLVSSSFLSTSTADSYQGQSSTRGIVTTFALCSNLLFVAFFA